METPLKAFSEEINKKLLVKKSCNNLSYFGDVTKDLFLSIITVLLLFFFECCEKNSVSP